MLLQDFIDLVSEGGLHQISVTDAQIIRWTNLGLVDLYSRFPLDSQEFVLSVSADISIYNLPSDFMSISSAFTPAKYHRDIYGNLDDEGNSTEGLIELELNVTNGTNAVYLSNPGKIQIPYPVDAQLISILYRANPIKLTVDGLLNDIGIAEQYYNALQYFVINQGFMSNHGGTESDTHLYFQRYQQACSLLENQGLVPKEYDTNNRFDLRGFI